MSLKKLVEAFGKPLLTREIGLLGGDTRFRGKVRFQGTLRVDGLVEGDIEAPAGTGSVLIINQEARVTGDVVADQVLISGYVKGDVLASERVEIYRSGELQGNIYTKDIMIEAGAAFAGSCHMNDEKAKQSNNAKADSSKRGQKVSTQVASTT